MNISTSPFEKGYDPEHETYVTVGVDFGSSAALGYETDMPGQGVDLARLAELIRLGYTEHSYHTLYVETASGSVCKLTFDATCLAERDAPYRWIIDRAASPEELAISFQVPRRPVDGEACMLAVGRPFEAWGKHADGNLGHIQTTAVRRILVVDVLQHHPYMDGIPKTDLPARFAAVRRRGTSHQSGQAWV